MSQRLLKNINKDSFSDDLVSALGECCQKNDLNKLVRQYSESVTSTLDKHAPSRSVTLKGVTSKKWYDDEVHEARQKQLQM